MTEEWRLQLEIQNPNLSTCSQVEFLDCIHNTSKEWYSCYEVVRTVTHHAQTPQDLEYGVYSLQDGDGELEVYDAHILAETIENDAAVDVGEEAHWRGKHDAGQGPVQTPTCEWAHSDEDDSVERQ